MENKYSVQQSTAPLCQPLYTLDSRSDLTTSERIYDLSTSEQVSDLKKWIIISIVADVMVSLGIVGFLIFIYYTLLIEVQ